MIKRGLLLLVIFCTLKTNAQNYLITFAGTGASTIVNTVIVENLRSGTILTLNGDDVLQLTLTVGISDAENEKSPGIKIYPNPMAEKSTLLISAPDEGEAIISVFDITGKVLTQIESYIENYTQEFSLSGLRNGIYIINVKGNTYQFSGKLISNGKSNVATSIEKVSDRIAVDKKFSKMEAKGVQTAVDMDFTIGDRLKFTGISGIYSTVVTEILDADKTITFNFIDCTDGDNNNYPVVEIGTQTWMGENLKTTRYNDGTEIPLITGNTEWGNLITPAYCWYNNDESTYKNLYGALYNGYAASTGNLCPTGWHVPANDEWTQLNDYVGGNSEAGGKLKETGTSHWINPNTGAINETGFTALPGGLRQVYQSVVFYSVGLRGDWWSSTYPQSDYYDYSWHMYYTSSNATSSNNYARKFGYSVRCVKD